MNLLYNRYDVYKVEGDITIMSVLNKYNRIADEHGFKPVSPKELLSKKRQRHIVNARHIVMATLRYKGFRTATVGRLLKRNHATVIYACKQVRYIPELKQIYKKMKI